MWNIHLVKNTVTISSECAHDLQKWYYYEFDDDGHEIVDDKSKIDFNVDHCEHRDYCTDRKFKSILKKHKVSGEICWLDAEGSSDLRMWGYRFFDGVMIPLQGEISWLVAEK